MTITGEIREGDRLVDGGGPFIRRFVVNRVEDRGGFPRKSVLHLRDEALPEGQDSVVIDYEIARQTLNRDPVHDARDSG